MNGPLLDLAAAAEYLNIGETTLRDMVTARTVPHRRSGKTRGISFAMEDLDAIIDSWYVPPAGQPTASIDAAKARTIQRGRRAA